MKRTMSEWEINERFAGLADLDDRRREFLTKEILPYYVFYDRKKKYAYCSACGAEFKASQVRDLRHNNDGVCPVCGASIIGKSLGYGHNVEDTGTGVIMDRLDGDIVIRYYYVLRSYEKNMKKPLVWIKEEVRDVYGDVQFEQGKSTVKGFKAINAEIYDNADRWRKVYWQSSYYGYSQPHWGFHFMHGLPSKYFKLYMDNLEDTLRGTCYEHCELAKFAEQRIDNDSPWCYGWYFDEYAMTSMWEYMMKMGMFKFARNLWSGLKSYSKIEIFKERRTLQEMLGITRTQLQELRTYPNPTVELMKYMRMGMGTKEYDAYGDLLSADKCHALLNCYRFSPEKFRAYIASNGMRDVLVGDYVDYRVMCKKCGRDMRNTMVVFPKHYKEAHDEVVTDFNKVKMEINEMTYDVIRKTLAEYSYSNDKLSIVVPEHCSDISTEGQKLHHCVGTYIDRVCKGETAILFIRMNSEMGKPFYTMEVASGRMVQCRGFGNKGMTDEVKSFVSSFCKAKHISMAA